MILLIASPTLVSKSKKNIACCLIGLWRLRRSVSGALGLSCRAAIGPPVLGLRCWVAPPKVIGFGLFYMRARNAKFAKWHEFLATMSAA